MQDISIEKCLFNQYGPIMSLMDVAVALKYPSKDSVRKAISRGTFPVAVLKIPNRKEIFLKTSDVANYLEKITSKC